MQSLSDKGLQKAREMISRNFADPSSLDDISVLSFQLEKQLAAAEGQLNGAVQSKLDSLKRAVDLMDESAVKLTKLSSNINRIDDKIAQTNTAISKYDYLKRVHNARDNLSKVIAQVEFFAKVPERAKVLGEQLDKNPTSLKEVYVESLKYESLRVALMKEIRVSRNRKKSVTSMSPTREVSKALGGDYSEDAFQKIRDAVEMHLQTVPELVQDVRQRVFGNIERMWDLASNSPADLVTSFEVIEMQQEYNDRRNRALTGVVDNTRRNSSQDAHENIVATVDAMLKRLLDDKVEGEFEALTSYNEENLSRVTALIMSANQVLQKMSIFKEEVVPCMPPRYEPMLLFVNCFEAQLLPRVEEMMRGAEALKVGEILDFINWIEYHKACMEEFDFADRESIESFASTKTELMIEYKTKIKAQVSSWFENIKNQPLEITKGSDDTLITSHPEDMFNIIHAQVEVAREKLPLEYTKEVAIACLQVLQNVQRQSYDALSNLWRGMDPEAMCATINDNQRMQEKCDEFGEYLCRFVEEGPEKEILLAILQEVSNEYIALAVKAVNFLAKCILEDLDEHFFSRIFSPEWEAGDDLCSVLTATLADYFKDLSSWLSQYFYSKFVKETLVTVINNYVMTLRRRANGSFTFSSEILAANRIISDKTTIEAFFDLHKEALKRGGLKGGKRGAKSAAAAGGASTSTLLMDEMEPMMNLARVISSRNLQNAETDAKSLFERWGADGLRVVQAAILSNPSISKPEKAQIVEKAKILFDSGCAGTAGAAPYSTALMEEFVSYDAAGLTNSAANANKETGNRGFWGRKKETKK